VLILTPSFVGLTPVSASITCSNRPSGSQPSGSDSGRRTPSSGGGGGRIPVPTYLATATGELEVRDAVLAVAVVDGPRVDPALERPRGPVDVDGDTVGQRHAMRQTVRLGDVARRHRRAVSVAAVETPPVWTSFCRTRSHDAVAYRP